MCSHDLSLCFRNHQLLRAMAVTCYFVDLGLQSLLRRDLIAKQSLKSECSRVLLECILKTYLLMKIAISEEATSSVISQLVTSFFIWNTLRNEKIIPASHTGSSSEFYSNKQSNYLLDKNSMVTAYQLVEKGKRATDNRGLYCLKESRF